jgi:hypothetical protein
MRIPSIFFLLALLLLTTASCSLEERIERREDRLIGTWIIDRARFDEPGDLFRDNLDDELKGDVLTFFADGTVFYEARDGFFFDGFWRITAVREQTDGERDVEFFIDAEFFRPSGTFAFAWLGVITRLTRNNFNLTVQEPGGSLILRLDRLD